MTAPSDYMTRGAAVRIFAAAQSEVRTEFETLPGLIQEELQLSPAQARVVEGVCARWHAAAQRQLHAAAGDLLPPYHPPPEDEHDAN